MVSPPMNYYYRALNDCVYDETTSASAWYLSDGVLC